MKNAKWMSIYECNVNDVVMNTKNEKFKIIKKENLKFTLENIYSKKVITTSCDICVELIEEPQQEPQQENTVIAENGTIVKLTKLEHKVVSELKECDWFEERPTEGLQNLVIDTKIPSKILRGVLSSLQQKDVIYVSEYPNGQTCYMLCIQ